MKRVSIMLVVPLLALTAACGGDSGEDGAASGSPATRSPADPRDAQVKYARCLRENGVPDYPDDPTKLPAGRIEIPERAVKACAKWERSMGTKTIDPNDPETRDRFLRLARCMRAHGVDWPDPAPGSLGGPPPDLSGVKDRPRVEKVLKQCQQVDPRWGGAAPSRRP